MRQVHGRGPESGEERACTRIQIRHLRAVDVRVLLDLARDVRLVVVARAREVAPVAVEGCRTLRQRC